MTKRQWKKRIYRGMAEELHHQAFGLGALWLTTEHGDPLPDCELIRMKEAALEIIAAFRHLGAPRPSAGGRRRFLTSQDA